MSSLVQTLSISDRRSILDAVEHIEAGALQIVFVVDDVGRLVGVVTNGDLRRHLLQGGKTDLPVTACMNRQFRAVPVGTAREELLKLFDLGYLAIQGWMPSNGWSRPTHASSQPAPRYLCWLGRARRCA